MLARLAAAAEFRDDDTGQHTRRVGDLSVTIAQHVGLSEANVELIRLAAPLHDLGRIAIPDSILGEPDQLTTGEFQQMKTHTTIGAEMQHVDDREEGQVMIADSLPSACAHATNRCPPSMHGLRASP